MGFFLSTSLMGRMLSTFFLTSLKVVLALLGLVPFWVRVVFFCWPLPGFGMGGPWPLSELEVANDAKAEVSEGLPLQKV